MDTREKSIGFRRVSRNGGKSGQSLVELVVGLLALVLVLMGLLQIGRIGMEHTQVLMEARRDADTLVMQDRFLRPEPGAFYADGVVEGRDRRPHTQHDYTMPGDPGRIIRDVVAHANVEDVSVWVPENAMEDFQYPSSFMQPFDLTYSHRMSDSIEMYPIIRNLVAGRDSMRVSRTVWMPWLRGVE